MSERRQTTTIKRMRGEIAELQRHGGSGRASSGSSSSGSTGSSGSKYSKEHLADADASSGSTGSASYKRRLQTDQSRTLTTTLSNVSGFSFPVEAYEIWIVTYEIDCGAGLSTSGLKIAVDVPSGAGVLNVQAQLLGDAPATAKTYGQRTTTDGAALDFTAANLTGISDGRLSVIVYLENGATPGTIELQAAQSTSSATSLLLRRGSFLVAHKI